jgi:dihydroorotate dehydrogenase
MSLANMARMCQAFPDRAFSGIGGVSDFNQALSYFLLGAGTVQVCTAAMLDQAVGPHVIQRLNAGLDAFLDKHADKWSCIEDFRGARRDRVVAQSQIRRPAGDAYDGGYEIAEGYSSAERPAALPS